MAIGNIGCINYEADKNSRTWHNIVGFTKFCWLQYIHRPCLPSRPPGLAAGNINIYLNVHIIYDGCVCSVCRICGRFQHTAVLAPRFIILLPVFFQVK